MTHQSRNRGLGIKTKHSKSRCLRKLPGILEGKGSGSYQRATLRKVNDRVLQRVSYIQRWCWEDKLKKQDSAEYKARPQLGQTSGVIK